MQLLGSAKLRFPVDLVIWHFVCAAQVGSPHPKRDGREGQKEKLVAKRVARF